MGAVGPIAMLFGAFALLPLQNDEDNEPVDEIDPVEPVDPSEETTVNSDGGKTTQVPLVLDDDDRPEDVAGTDGDDVNLVDPTSTDEFWRVGGAGDDQITIGLYQGAGDWDPNRSDRYEDTYIDDLDGNGADIVTIEFDSDIASQIEAEGYNYFFAPTVNIGPADGLRLQVPDDVEGRIVRVDTEFPEIPDRASTSGEDVYASYFLLVPDTVDIVALQVARPPESGWDGANYSQTVEELMADGAIALAKVSTGAVGYIDGEAYRDTRFILTDVKASRAITTIGQ